MLVEQTGVSVNLSQVVEVLNDHKFDSYYELIYGDPENSFKLKNARQIPIWMLADLYVKVIQEFYDYFFLEKKFSREAVYAAAIEKRKSLPVPNETKQQPSTHALDIIRGWHPTFGKPPFTQTASS